jgi:hypothetical protein
MKIDEKQVSHLASATPDNEMSTQLMDTTSVQEFQSAEVSYEHQYVNLQPVPDYFPKKNQKHDNS